MVVEHTFVTTKEGPDALDAAARFLSRRGFEASTASAFPVGGVAQTLPALEMRRGKKRAGRAKNITELPQVAHVEWDRGRVTVALSIEPSHAWGGSNFVGFSVGTPDGNPKRMMLLTQMMTAIASGLECVLVRDESPYAAAQAWDAVEQECLRAARRRNVRNWIIVGVMLALLAGVITLIVMYA